MIECRFSDSAEWDTVHTLCKSWHYKVVAILLFLSIPSTLFAYTSSFCAHDLSYFALNFVTASPSPSAACKSYYYYYEIISGNVIVPTLHIPYSFHTSKTSRDPISTTSPFLLLPSRTGHCTRYPTVTGITEYTNNSRYGIHITTPHHNINTTSTITIKEKSIEETTETTGNYTKETKWLDREGKRK